MRIGIVTHPLEANYGGILQNYALQTILRKFGHEPITLRIGRIPLKGYIIWFASIMKNSLLFAAGKRYKFNPSPWRILRDRVAMSAFINKNICCTPKQFVLSQNLIKRYGLDALVVGSDQVWRPKYVLDIYAMFFSFASDTQIHKIAYAASFGTDVWEYTSEQTERCKILAKKFEAISVREQSGIELCKNYLDVDATWCVDPTMLVSKEEYENVCSSEKKENNILLAYFLDQDEEKENVARRIAAEKNLDTLIISAGRNIDKSQTVELWLARFRDAAYVVTDSYHGTIFSLIFHKDFNVFYNINRGLTRFDTLVNVFDIGSRFITDTENIETTEMNWKEISIRLGDYSKLGLTFLDSNLK